MLDGQQPEEPEFDEDQVAAAVDVPAAGDTLQNAVPAEALVTEQLLLALGPVSVNEVYADGEFEVGIRTDFHALFQSDEIFSRHRH